MTTPKWTLQTLSDRAEIGDVVLAYATGVDRRDWALYRSAFAEVVEFDFRSFMGGEILTMRADEWVEIVKGTLSGFDATQHMSSNHVITVDGDLAICVSYMVAHHVFANFMEGDYFTMGGYYTNSLRREADGWKIYKCYLTNTWATGNRHIFELAEARFKSRN